MPSHVSLMPVSDSGVAKACAALQAVEGPITPAARPPRCSASAGLSKREKKHGTARHSPCGAPQDRKASRSRSAGESGGDIGAGPVAVNHCNQDGSWLQDCPTRATGSQLPSRSWGTCSRGRPVEAGVGSRGGGGWLAHLRVVKQRCCTWVPGPQGRHAGVRARVHLLGYWLGLPSHRALTLGAARRGGPGSRRLSGDRWVGGRRSQKEAVK